MPVRYTFAADAATAGTFVYVAGSATEFSNFFGFAADYASGSINFNGDDAIELFYRCLLYTSPSPRDRG